MPHYDQHPAVPPGYTTAPDLAARYNRSVAGVRIIMKAHNVPSIRCERRNAAGINLGGHSVRAYHELSAHAALSSKHVRASSTALPGYIGLIALTYKLTRAQVRDALAAAGVRSEQRICQCCGKPTLYYPDRKAAKAAMHDYMRRYPLPPTPSGSGVASPPQS